MAGPNQHYIPQLLLKNFAKKGFKGWRTWVYRPDSVPENKHVRNYGADFDFYESVNWSGIDDLISNFENEAGNTLKYLIQNRGELDESGIEKVARLVAHFECRTKLVRQGFSRIAQITFDKINKKLDNPKFIECLMVTAFRRDPDMLYRSLRDRGLSEIDAGFYAEAIRPHIPHLIRTQAPSLCITWRRAFKEVYKGAATIAREGR